MAYRKEYFIDNFEELLSTVGHLRPYLRVYDEKDVMLFNSRFEGDAKMLSNFHDSSVPLPWRGKTFISVEAMIFYAFIEDNCNNPKWEGEKMEVLEALTNVVKGNRVREVKDKLYKKVRKAYVDEYGEENWDLYAWRVSGEAIKVKYDHCPEFRELVYANKDKQFAEYQSFNKSVPKAGVKKITDEKSPYCGKYIGCNFTGISIQRCITK